MYVLKPEPFAIVFLVDSRLPTILVDLYRDRALSHGGHILLSAHCQGKWDEIDAS